MAAAVRRDVEVDQRSLVKKILSRYPTAFPPIRELVQNADDAGATEVRISLETDRRLPAAPGAEPELLSRVVVWNNGRAFSDQDWVRIRRIASGNTSSDAIGMFGVGFFTVFALTDEPAIVSGSSRMRFFWGGSEHDLSGTTSDTGKLVTETLPLAQPFRGAAFELPLSATSDAARWCQPEELQLLRRTLASSLLFTKSIGRIVLTLTGQPPLTLSREISPLRSAPCSPSGGGPPPLFHLPSRQIELATRTITAALDGATAACRMLQASVVQTPRNRHVTAA